MKTQKISVFTKRLLYKPNLTNYQKTYQKFSYKDHLWELSFFKNKKINAAYNAIDRHISSWRKNKIALFWEGTDGTSKKFTFYDLALLSNKLGNVLKKYGVKKNDRVFIFLPRIPELYISFLSILKIGAIAGTLFSAFQTKALEDRLKGSGAKILITNEELKKRVEPIRKKLTQLEKIITVEKDFWQEVNQAKPDLLISQTNANDSAFMLYTSGTTGKPKGVVHQHYAILHEHLTAKWVLDIKEDDVYWCTADPGWVTGIAYEILGTWSNGSSTLVYEGKFDPEKWYDLIARYKVTVWYTAPTAIRMLAAAGLKLIQKYDLSSLRHMASVGEPLNPEPIYWGLKAFKKPFHDNYWQTETGGIVTANYPCMDIKPGSMGKPVPGITAAIVDNDGKELGNNQQGNLALKPGWPSMMIKIWRKPEKYKSYFKNGWYITGDLAYKDKDGYFWFIGRNDDVIKTSGERVGPFEVESAIVAHPSVIEAGVIGKPDPLRGEIIKAFVVLKKEVKPSENLKKEIALFVKKNLAGHAYPREIEFIDKLPKTRSGKIVRRILKAKELGLPIGDTSTLEEY